MIESKERKLGAVLSYVAIGINFIIGLVYTPLQVRMLGQSEYGLFSLTSSIIGYLTLMDLGFGNAIIVYTSKYRANNSMEEEKRLHGMFAWVYRFIGIISVVLGAILYLNVEAIFGNKMTPAELSKMKVMMLILSFNLFITFYFNIYNSIICAYEKFTFHKIISIIHSLIKPLIMLPLLFMGFKSISLCIVITLANVFSVLSNYIYCKRKLHISTKFSGFDKNTFKSVIGYSIWIFLGVIVDKANWSVDNFVLGIVAGTVAVSVYSVAAHINQIFISLSTAISGVMLPKMSKLVAKNASPEELTDEMIKVGRLQNYIIFLMCSGLIMFGKNFVAIWVGPDYSESYYVALLLIVPVCIPLIQNLGISIIQAMNKNRFRAIATFIMAIANIIISVFLAKKWGAVGAAMGTCIALIVCNILIMNIYYYRSIKLNIIRFWKSIIKQCVAFMIPIVIILLFMAFTKLGGLTAFLTYSLIYTAMYLLTAYFIAMNSYERKMVDNVLIKLHLKKANYAKNN